jgi:hypothetical protein
MAASHSKIELDCCHKDLRIKKCRFHTRLGKLPGKEKDKLKK